MMTDGAALCFFIAFGIFSKGLTAVIETQQTVMAAVGDKAYLKCQLMQTKDVLQVTWQKFSPQGDYNVATYNKPFGQTVNAGFKGKVEFVDAGLQSSSIVINNVTEQDEGCYLCLFNSYPDGALTGRTCLQVYELHQPVLHVRASNSTEELVVSCSATGRPAPTVTLRATPQDHNLTDYNSVSVSNTNGTVTVTTTAVLSALHLNSTQVGCTVGVLSGPQIDVLETIPGLKPTSADDFTWIFILLAVACGFVAAFCICICVKQRNKKCQPPCDARINKAIDAFNKLVYDVKEGDKSETTTHQEQPHCGPQMNEILDELGWVACDVKKGDKSETTTNQEQPHCDFDLDMALDTLNQSLPGNAEGAEMSETTTNEEEPLRVVSESPIKKTMMPLVYDLKQRGHKKDEEKKPDPSPSTEKLKSL